MKNAIIYFLVTIATFLTPIKGLFLLVSFAVLCDTICAMYSVIKLQGIKHISSTKFFNIVVKTWFYLGSIILAYLVDVYILENELLGVTNLVSKVVCVVWISIEVKSLDETSQKLGNRPFLEVLKALITKLKSLKKDLNDLKN
jgi:phage-related holin